MKKRWILCLLLGLVVLLAGCDVTAQSELMAEENPQPQRQVIEAFGVVKCRENHNVLVDFPAKAVKVSVREGQRIHKGDVIATLCFNELNSQIKTKELQLAGEQKVLAQLEKETDEKEQLLTSGQDPDIVKLQNDLLNAKDDHRTLKEELASKKKLAATGSITQNEVDHFKKSVDTAEKTIEEIKLSLDILEYGKKMALQQLQNQILTRKNSIEIMRRELKLMSEKTNKEYLSENDMICTIDNAIVEGVYIANGDVLSPPMKLFSLMNLDTQYVEARIPEDFIKDVTPGMKADVIPFADKSRRYTGYIVEMAEKAQHLNGETNILVQIDLTDDDAFLMPGFNVDVEIPY